MTNKQFFQLSEEGKNTRNFFINPDNLYRLYAQNYGVEWTSAIYHYVMGNPPYAFKDLPLLYEQVKQFVAFKLNVPYDSIRLTGSGKTGFSMDPKQYGRPFSEKSDLDFVIVNDGLFDGLCEDVRKWMRDYVTGAVSPTKYYNKSNWDSNYDNFPSNMESGFVDAFRLPSFPQYSTAYSIHTLMIRLTANLKEFQNIVVDHSTVRVYRDIKSFYDRILYNINSAMAKVAESR